MECLGSLKTEFQDPYVQGRTLFMCDGFIIVFANSSKFDCCDTCYVLEKVISEGGDAKSKVLFHLATLF